MDPRQVIYHYYTHLEKYMDPDSVALMMHIENLINDDDYKAITAAPNDLKMNCFLLQYVMQYAKQQDRDKLSRFCHVLMRIETQNYVGEKLLKCKKFL